MKAWKLYVIFLLLVTSCKSDQTGSTNGTLTYEKRDSVMKLRSTETTKKEQPSAIDAWRNDCDVGLGEIIFYKNSDSCFITVMSNNIYIWGTVVPINNTEINIKLKRPDIVGGGGARLDWPNFSKDSAICTITSMDSTSAKLNWKGLYNTKTQEFFKMSEFSADDSNNRVIIKKCSSPNASLAVE